MGVGRSVSELQEMISRSAFHQLFDPQVLDADPEKLSLTLKLHMSSALERQPGTGQWHGGALLSIVDIAGCYALAMLTGKPEPTINFHTDFLRPAVNTDLVSVALVRKQGRNLGVVDVDILDDNQKLVAVGRGCYSIRQQL